MNTFILNQDFATSDHPIHARQPREGDRCFMLKADPAPDSGGIVSSGVFQFCPEAGRCEFVADLKAEPVLPTALLAERLPGIDWTGRHPAVPLDPEAALTLEKLWYEHLKTRLSPHARAALLARIAHFGQTDKAGEDYICHPLRVSSALSGDEAVVALLHDVVEDTPLTLDLLRREGFSEEVVAGVNAMTRRQGETYEAFVRRAGRNQIARTVKMADLADNMNLLRLPQLTDKDLQRVGKYHKAYRYLSSL